MFNTCWFNLFCFKVEDFCTYTRGGQIFLTHTLLIFPHFNIGELILTHTHQKIWQGYSYSYSWGKTPTSILILTQTHTHPYSLILRLILNLKLTACSESALNILHMMLLRVIRGKVQEKYLLNPQESQKWPNIFGIEFMFPKISGCLMLTHTHTHLA